MNPQTIGKLLIKKYLIDEKEMIFENGLSLDLLERRLKSLNSELSDFRL